MSLGNRFVHWNLTSQSLIPFGNYISWTRNTNPTPRLVQGLLQQITATGITRLR